MSNTNETQGTTTQEKHLNKLIQDKTTVSVYLVNGIKLEGVISSHDQYTIFLARDTSQQMIYKHAISTVVTGTTQRRP